MSTEEQAEAPEPEPKIEVKKCGCRLAVFPDGHQDYEPCLVHALDTAGKSLCAAAARMEKLLLVPNKPGGPRRMDN